MNEMDFTFEATPWELTMDALKEGGSLSAARFLALMEGEDEEYVEEALADLEARRVSLDVSDLPKPAGTGEAAVRLRREEQLAADNKLLESLEANDPLRLYLEELAAIPVCGDVQVLARECVNGKESAREKLLNASLYRVVELAESYVGRGVLLLDLIQEGSMGAWQGILSYEGGDFEAHRDWWVGQALAKVVTMQARSNGVGQKMRQALEDYRAVDERLLGDLGRNPTVEEIAEELHISPEETARIAQMLENVRLMDKIKAVEQPKEEEDHEAEQAVEDTAYFQMRQRIGDLLSGLSEEDAKLLSLRFGLEGGLPLNPEDTGKKLGLTAEEVVAREAKALAQLRQG
ncbi:MAG: sigma-70 family RNA polymerase sigma factor [Oscillospiraceae bacterium]|nr:sigma-70 family RNA polymerase sigma factor [Oscillospiraceae bacterium]